MSKAAKIVILVFLFLMLVLLRFTAYKFSYDPFISYFRHDYLSKPIPEFNSYRLLFSMFVRYFLNTVISLMIIWVAFQNRNMIRFSVKFYTIAFIFLIFVFFVILKSEFKHGYLLAFYIRRFIVHPLFVLILLPAFYYKYLKE